MAPMGVRAAVPHVPGTWRLIYFNAPNRGEQIRLLFHVAGIAFSDVRCTPYPQGLDPYRKAAMGDGSPLLGSDQCPAVTAPDGTHCVETADIMRFVGQRVGWAPKADSAEDATAMEMCVLAQEVIDKVFYGLLMRACVKHIAAKEFLGVLKHVLPRVMLGSEKAALQVPTQVLHGALSRIEACLANSGGPFVLGLTPSYADVALFDALDKAFQYDFAFDKAQLLASHPKLATMFSEMGVRCQGWLERRVQEHMCGERTIAGFLAVTNTPFRWSRVKAPEQTTDTMVMGREKQMNYE